MKRFVLFLSLVSSFCLLHAQDSSLQEYTGTYKFPDGSVVPSVEIKMENGALMVNSSMGSAGLEKVTKDTFNVLTYDGMAYFSRNADKKIDGIRIVVHDMILEGKKDSTGLSILIEDLFKRARKLYYCVNEKPKTSSRVISFCSPVSLFFILHKPDLISSSPMIATKEMFFFSAYLNCLSNFAVS